LLLSMLIFAIGTVGFGMRWAHGRLSFRIESILEAAETCGNGVCDAGETKQSCPKDCRLLLKLLRQGKDGTGRARRATRSSESVKLGPGDSRGSITIDGRERTYLLHRPAGEDPAKQYPLVMVFHGGHGAGAKIAKQTGFSGYADREGFIAVYPDGIEHNWSDGRGTTDAERLGVDDVKFVKALLARLQKELSIDEKRIYVTGPSNGGIFTYRLGCEMADVFAAIAPVIGNLAEPLGMACAPQEAVSVLAINGDADPFIPIQGGECCKRGDGGRLLSTKDSLNFFVKKNGCSGTPVREMLPAPVDDGTTLERHTYPACGYHTDVVWYVIHGGGHAWPPKPPQAPRISGPSSKNIDATSVIWQFFKAHPKAR